MEGVAVRMPKVSIELMVGIVVLTRSGNLRDAAGEMGMSLSRLQNRPLDAEKLLGVRLVDRSRSGLELTCEGRALYNYAVRATNLILEMGDAIAVTGGSGRDSLSMGEGLDNLLWMVDVQSSEDKRLY
jgi:DNA-binding transcriptional LysR family regulator